MHATARPLDRPRRSRDRSALARLVLASALLFVAVAAVIAAAVLAVADPASAHATLVSSSPATGQLVDDAPREIIVRFDEAVDLDLGGGLRVFAPDGRRVDRTSLLRDGGSEVATSIDSTQIGTYTVAWRVVSEDSHVLTGSFVFHVLRETGAVAVAEGVHVLRETGAVAVAEADRTGLDVLAWLARWAIVAAMVILGGLATFGLFVSREGSLDRSARRVIVSLAVIGLIGGVLRFAVQVAVASGRSLTGSASLWSEAVGSTRAGRIDAARVAALVVVVIAALAWTRRRSLVVAMVGAAGVAFANAYGGHAWTVEDSSLALMASVVHQGAVAVWVGGLAGLVLLLRRASGAAAAARFSSIATWALVATAASVVGWYQSGLLDGLFSTGYGRVIVAKIVVALAMASVGYRNRSRLGDFAERRASFVRGVRGEVVLAIVALGLTAALVGMVPASSAADAGIFSASYDDAAGSLSVTVTPARSGANTMHLYFYDTDGRPRTVDVAEATVSIGVVPARRIDLAPITQGHFSAAAFSLPSAGNWTIAIKSVSRGQVTTSSFEVRVS